MGNLLTVNPLVFDTSGATSEITDQLEITGYVVIASGDTWSCIFHDIDSGTNVIIRADSIIANHRSVYWSPAMKLRVKGLYWTTKTNITTVIVYHTGKFIS